MNSESIKTRVRDIYEQAEDLIQRISCKDVHDTIRIASIPVLDMITSGAEIFLILAGISEEGRRTANEFVNESESTIKAIYSFIEEKNNEQE